MLLETNQLAGEAQHISYYSGSSLREGKKTNSSHHKKQRESSVDALFSLPEMGKEVVHLEEAYSRQSDVAVKRMRACNRPQHKNLGA
jgi:hypothetical protein